MARLRKTFHDRSGLIIGLTFEDGNKDPHCLKRLTQVVISSGKKFRSGIDFHFRRFSDIIRALPLIDQLLHQVFALKGSINTLRVNGIQTCSEIEDD